MNGITERVFRIPGRLNAAAARMKAELPKNHALGMVQKCVEEGAEAICALPDPAGAIVEEGDGDEYTLRYNAQMGELEKQLDLLVVVTGRTLSEILPTLFATGFRKKEPIWMHIIAECERHRVEGIDLPASDGAQGDTPRGGDGGSN